ncbi:hypothetical protein diail_9397 [Diaporthe ilicicola]|nr:hypothetical protein diail_9397 [Diaporthe ilicicola]
MILKWDRLGPDHEVSGPDDFSRLTFDVIGLCAMNYRFNFFYAEEPPRFITAMADALVEAGRVTNRMAVAEQEMIAAWTLIFQRFNIELADPEYQLKIKPTLTIKPDDFKFKVRRRPGKDRRYRSGDYLVVLLVNPCEQIRRVMSRFGLHPDDLLAQDEHMTAFELIGTRVELATPASQRQVAALASKLPTSEKLKTLTSDVRAYRGEVLEMRASVLDLLEDFPDCPLTFAEYLAMLQPLAPRQYSISSSPLVYPPVSSSAAAFPSQNTNDTATATTTSVAADDNKDDDSSTSLACSITCDVLEGTPALSGHGSSAGVASSYLSNLPAGSCPRCSVRGTAASKFRLPPVLQTPVIIVAAGTGIAPMRAFIQERPPSQGVAGEPTRRWARRCCTVLWLQGPLARFPVPRTSWRRGRRPRRPRVRPAFSQRAPLGQGQGPAHVDEVIWTDRDEVRRPFKDGVGVLVCGSASSVGRNAHEVCVRIYREGHPETSAEEAEECGDEAEGGLVS